MQLSATPTGIAFINGQQCFKLGIPITSKIQQKRGGAWIQQISILNEKSNAMNVSCDLWENINSAAIIAHLSAIYFWDN